MLGWLRNLFFPKFVMVCVACVGVQHSFVTDKLNFRHFSCGTNANKAKNRTLIFSKEQLDSTVVSLGEKFAWIASFFVPKDRIHDFSRERRTFKLLRTWGFHMVQFGWLSLGFGFIIVDAVSVFLENPRQKASPSLSCWGIRSSVIALLVSLCATVRIRGTQPAQTLQWIFSAIIAIALPWRWKARST